MKARNIAIIATLVLITGVALLLAPRISGIYKLYNSGKIFNADKIENAFRNQLDGLYPTITLEKSAQTFDLVTDIQDAVFPESFEYAGETFLVAEEIDERSITSLLILKDGKLIFEQYYRGNSADDKVILFSVTKSIMSILVGIAYEAGDIENLDDTAVKYAPELAGTVYEDVTIQNLLDMASGVQWREEYNNPNSEFAGSMIAILTGSLNDYSKQMQRTREQGVFNQYTSMDAQILSLIVQGATGIALADYLNQKLWLPLGTEYDAYFATDATGFPMAYGGLMMATRDLAKIGLMMLNNGKNPEGVQIISPEWITQSTTPDKPYLMPGIDNPDSDTPEGYKNQWWIPINRDGGDYSALGIYGQTLYINPERNIIIASNSAYANYMADDEHADSRRIAMFQAIAKFVDEQQ